LWHHHLKISDLAFYKHKCLPNEKKNRKFPFKRPSGKYLELVTFCVKNVFSLHFSRKIGLHFEEVQMKINEIILKALEVILN
jgi:hypothetical protein